MPDGDSRVAPAAAPATLRKFRRWTSNRDMILRAAIQRWLAALPLKYIEFRPGHGTLRAPRGLRSLRSPDPWEAAVPEIVPGSGNPETIPGQKSASRKLTADNH